MAYLKSLETQKDITRYVNFKKNQEVNLVTQVALDGTEYLTRYGKPVCSYELEVHVNDAGKELLMAAQDTLEELEVSVKAGTFKGRVKALGEFETEYFGWYKTTVTLSASSEVSGR